MSTLGLRIYNRREQLRLTQEALGELIGKDQKMIWRYETGKSQPTADVVIALAKALETTTDYLLGVSNVVRHVDDEHLSTLEREAVETLRSTDKETQRKIVKAIKALV